MKEQVLSLWVFAVQAAPLIAAGLIIAGLAIAEFRVFKGFPLTKIASALLLFGALIGASALLLFGALIGAIATINIIGW